MESVTQSPKESVLREMPFATTTQAKIASLSCLNIDFDLIKVYVPEFNASIYGAEQDQEYLAKEIEKFYYSKCYKLALDELFQAVRNYFIANSRLDLVDKIMRESGLYCYYGSDNTGCYLPDLLIATRYASLRGMPPAIIPPLLRSLMISNMFPKRVIVMTDFEEREIYPHSCERSGI